nr:hypothetical protein [Tanacetum cinerariifolium]
MGWNEVTQAVDHPLWHNIPDKARFYFVHSYYIESPNPRQIVGRGHYGHDFAAALADGSRFAVQFHPEKSHTHGLQLLQNFAAWDGRCLSLAARSSLTKEKLMLIIPAIDLKDGACVRLRQGRMEDSTVFSDDPVSMAAKWVEGGCRRLHLVDLNGAFEGQPVNGEVVTAIARRYPNLPIQIGGGIRSLETIEHYVKAGVSYVIIGTKAVKEPEFVAE